MRLTLDLLGVRYKYVTGYNSSAQAMLALQRGEISYYADSPPLYKSKIVPLVQAGELLPVFYDPDFNGVEFSVPSYVKGMSDSSVPGAVQSDQRHDAVGAACGKPTNPSSPSTAPCIDWSRCRPAHPRKR